MNSILLGFGFALAQAGGVTQPQTPTITLDEAIAIATQNSYSVQIAQAQAERARQRIFEFQGLLGPKVALGATYTRFDREISQSFGGQGGGSGSVVVQPIDSTTGSATASLPIDISGNLHRGVRVADYGYRAAKETLQATVNTVKLDVRTAYFNVLRAEALVSVQQEALTNAQARLANAQKEEAAGAIAHVDVLRFQTQVSQAQSDLIAAQNQVRLAKNAFNNALSRPIETPFEPADVTALPTVNASEQDLAQAAMNNRPEVLALGFQRQALSETTRLQRGGLSPQLSLGATYSHNFNPATSQRANSTTGVLQLSWPIFDSGVTRAKVKEAEQDEKAADLQQQQAQLGVSLEVRQAISNLVNAKSRLDVAVDQVKLAQETYRLAQVRFEAGEGIALEVLDAQTALTQAQTQLANARYDYLTAYSQLQRAVGNDDLAAAIAQAVENAKK